MTIAPEAPSGSHTTYTQILKSTLMIGGSSVVNVAFSIVRNKAVALMLGPEGIGLLGLYSSIADIAQALAGLGVQSSGVRQVAEAAATGQADRIRQTASVLNGLSILLGNSDDSQRRESGYLDLFEQQRVHGVLITPVEEDLPRLRTLRDHGIPVVLVDRQVADARFSSVSVDDVAGGRAAAEHLIERGRRRIAFVGGPVSIRQVVDRLSGARVAASERSAVSLEHVPTASLTVRAGEEAGRALVSAAPDRRPDAVFAANDLVAIGVLQAVTAGGLRVPDDIAIIGYDDIDYASTAIVPLTSMRQPASLIGNTAVDLLLEEAQAAGSPAPANPRQVVFQPELVVRSRPRR